MQWTEQIVDRLQYRVGLQPDKPDNNEMECVWHCSEL